MKDITRDIAPHRVVVRDDRVEADGRFCQTVYMYQYPPDLKYSFMKDLQAVDVEMDIATFIQPLPVQAFIELLRIKVAKDEMRIAQNKEQAEKPDYVIEQRLQDNLELMALMQRHETKPYQLTVAVSVWADSLAQLKKDVEKLERSISKITANLGGTRRCEYRSREGYLQSFPNGINHFNENKVNLYSSRIMHTHPLRAMFPFWE